MCGEGSLACIVIQRSSLHLCPELLFFFLVGFTNKINKVLEL